MPKHSFSLSTQTRRMILTKQKAVKSTYLMYQLKFFSKYLIAQSNYSFPTVSMALTYPSIIISDKQIYILAAQIEYLFTLLQMMKESASKEVDIIRRKLKENKLTCLKEYPNKYLLGKSRLINFKNNNEFFDERCMLFIEFTYLLLRLEVDQSTVYITKNIFLNHFGQIYYFYTFDSQYQKKMVKVSHGNLVQNIINTFNHIFLSQTEEIKDYQYQAIYSKLLNPLMTYFQSQKKKQEKYNPYRILVQLQNSDVFKEYNFSTKYNTAIMIRGIIDNKGKNENKINFVALSHQYEMLVLDLQNLHNPSTINKSIGAFYLNLLIFFKMLQKSLYLKVTISQSDFSSSFEVVKQDEVVCDISLQSNIKKSVSISETQQSPQSNDKELTKQQSEKYYRKKQYMESLFIFKNRVNFNIKIRYKIINKFFQIQIQALSLWAIQEIYFAHIRDFWQRFVNCWYNAANNSPDIHCKIQDFKFDILHNSKNICLKTAIKINQKENLLEELIIIYDKVLIIFLLLQQVFKKVYKLGYFINESNKRPLQEMNESVFMENKIAKLNQAFIKYSEYYQELIKLTKK